MGIVAELLKVPLAEIGPLSLPSPAEVQITTLCKNVGIVACLAELLKQELVIPERPDIISAAAAAVIAAELQRRPCAPGKAWERRKRCRRAET